jgi:hypothetical protein
MKSRLPALILLLAVALYQQCLKSPITELLAAPNAAFLPERFQRSFEWHLLLKQSAPLHSLISISELELIPGISGKTAKKLYKKLLQIRRTLSSRQPQTDAAAKKYIQSELEELNRIGPKKAKLLMRLFTIEVPPATLK